MRKRVKSSGKIKLAFQNLKFWLWAKRNPGGSFKAYFVRIASSDLASGYSHPSLGAKPKRSSHKYMATYGINPSDVCVDYGCGTLRFGEGIIRYLDRGNYWGLEIDQKFLDAGIRLIGPDLVEQKAPNLRVISDESVSEAAARKPALLFSVKVLIHVHPDDLVEYFRNILAIIGDSGTAIITGKWSTADSFQFARQSWAHSFPLLEKTVNELGGRLTVLKASEYRFDRIRKTAVSGRLKLDHKR